MRRAVVALALFTAACATAPPPGVLPTVEFGARSDNASPYFVVLITGDGGWRKIDIKVSDALRKAGMPVVGLLSNSYFARERTPEETAVDLDRLIHEYQAKWQRQRVVLVGYSRGAEALPFMINRLPDETRRDLAVVALLGPGLRTAFALDGPDRYPLVPELQQMKGLPLVCVYGTLEKESLCRMMPPGQGTVLSIRGGHHFGGDYDRIAKAILDALSPRG
ncbi:MAG TPA: AcvB/VirJ family lysyl-phosphatidylglycerol hydrolase [Thermoanaerobaculia bacterium]|nr:AcvB/VirJ family lysyl-phosphatidylglycerol hydrolase [Thermoanaerobaculia bacterium]